MLYIHKNLLKIVLQFHKVILHRNCDYMIHIHSAWIIFCCTQNLHWCCNILNPLKTFVAKLELSKRIRKLEFTLILFISFLIRQLSKKFSVKRFNKAVDYSYFDIKKKSTYYWRLITYNLYVIGHQKLSLSTFMSLVTLLKVVVA